MNRTSINFCGITVLSLISIFTSHNSFSASKPITEERSSPKIIGGQTADKNAYPFMTAIIPASNPSVTPFCGASFIGGRYVLTAAHCVRDTLPEEINVWIGGHDIRIASEGTRVAVNEIYMHEEYDADSYNKDIAILELESEVTNATPILMMTPEIEATLQEGDLLTIMGWGNTDTSTQMGDYPSELMDTQIPLYNRAACEEAYSENGQTTITEFMMCAGFEQGGQDTCQGDSGGPVIYEYNGVWYQAGIVSFGNGCAEANYPGINSRVAVFNDWIDQREAGVSYKQTRNIGFVESGFDDTLSVTISNGAAQSFAVENPQLLNATNVTNLAIVNDLCAGAVLAQNESCAITVNATSSGIGESRFTLQAQSDNAVSTPIIVKASFTALPLANIDMAEHTGSDDQKITWYSGGDSPWQVENTTFSDGATSVTSGNIVNLQTSSLLATISDPAVRSIDFDYLVSSEADYDFFTIMLNGELVLAESGSTESEFTRGRLPLSEETNRIVFMFEKDESLSEGDDAAYLDAISLNADNAAPVVVLADASISAEEQSTFTVDASASSDANGDTLSFQWEVLNNASVTIASPNASSTSVTAPSYASGSSFSLRVTVSDGFGGETQATVSVTLTQSPTSVTTTPNTGSASGGGGGSLGFLSVLFLALVLAARKPLITNTI
ncbi:trypsin-like serine protease [Glaciecola sp. 2405UD65-10]|uniref:serine protease n=1 Tax=Glaciecola sp. 2405UD65-10 TaxID=3397244 RepID=UPI003B5C63F1